jgi:hypothetical protein
MSRGNWINRCRACDSGESSGNRPQLSPGLKLSNTARTFNVTVNHRRRILSCTDGHPARWNDETLILFDSFIKGIQDREVLQDTKFFLHEHQDGVTVQQECLGCWVLCDNGYLEWSTTVPPHKCSQDGRAERWSEWIESMRKDVECTFGILKGRWRILKTGIRLHGTKPADQIFKTCCAPHNWLSEIDGLDDEWERGVPSEWWEGSLGQHHLSDPILRCIVWKQAMPTVICVLLDMEQEMVLAILITPRHERRRTKPQQKRQGTRAECGNSRFLFSVAN